MSLIEGIGDEVVHFFIGFLIFIIIAAAWWTTNIRFDRQIRTVYLIERRLRRRSHRSLTNHTHSATISESTLPTTSSERNDVTDHNAVAENVVSTDPDKPPEPSTSSDVDDQVHAEDNVHEQEQIEIVETMDSQTNVLRQRRITFYENRRETIIENNENDTENNDVSNNEVLTEQRENDNSQNTQDNVPLHIQDESYIRIKLKYINDDLKLVDGRLEELLGDFKRRHFNDELTSNKLVRLIFNGKVLQRDSQTLQSYGFFDNCVVHCLVHQQRTSAQEDSESRGDQSNQNFNVRSPFSNNNNNNNRDWDLSNVLITMISFSLGSAWYFRYQYPHLFTVTATVALVAITGIFTVVSIGMYFPDPEPPQPQMENVR